MPSYHMPVMVEEVVGFLKPVRDGVYLDGTLGTGGHAEAILEQSAPTGRVIGIDADSESLAIAEKRLAPYGERVVFVHARYDQSKQVLADQGVDEVDGVLLDLGISRVQLEMPDRGFSFKQEDPLDMRMDRTQGISAARLLKRLSEEEMARLFHTYGEERWARRIARAIVKKRKAQGEFSTTLELARTIQYAIPRHTRRPARIHPATRSFQALRIAVNRELDCLEAFLKDLPDLLCKGARCCVLSFHSLEDRIVKQHFRQLELGVESIGPYGPEPRVQEERFQRVMKKVVRPSPEERNRNPLSRSAKLRILERI